jgi:hypothetical protein
MMALWVLVLVALVVTSAKVEDVMYSNMKNHNAEALSTLLKLHRSDLGWTHVTSKGGVEVKKRFLPAGSFVDTSDATSGSKHACVRATAVVDAPVDKVCHGPYPQYPCFRVGQLLKPPSTHPTSFYAINSRSLSCS